MTGQLKSAIKHHRQEGIYIFHIINCIGIKRGIRGQGEQKQTNKQKLEQDRKNKT